jgi:uncharacterized repeat protein (TIGR03803 family)
VAASIKKESYGTIFKITSAGVLTAHSMCNQAVCTQGLYPLGGLVLAADENFYGTTANGGGNGGGDGDGTIFKITPGGTLTTLHSFANSDGMIPLDALVQGSDGNFYGTTSEGGIQGNGTVFKITPTGVLTTLHNFCSRTNCADGYNPTAALVEGNDGNFYGTTFYGGAFEPKGTVFRISPRGILTTLYSFCAQQSTCPDGSNPGAGLALATDGNFYGTTGSGGANGAGTIFKITPSGTLTTLYTFCSQTDCSDGSYPSAGLVQGSDGNFYGVTQVGGSFCQSIGGCGTIFQITPAGALTTLYSFSGTDGYIPYGGLLQATDGTFYGTTQLGGIGGLNNLNGTVFSLSMGLGPFVKLVQNSGKVGQTGGILGQGLTGTTEVAINGTPASFTVVSDTYLRVTIPAGATTGFVTVTTPAGVFTSNVVFQVR